jgi:hypothetical protein
VKRLSRASFSVASSRGSASQLQGSHGVGANDEDRRRLSPEAENPSPVGHKSERRVAIGLGDQVALISQRGKHTGFSYLRQFPDEARL